MDLGPKTGSLQLQIYINSNSDFQFGFKIYSQYLNLKNVNIF